MVSDRTDADPLPPEPLPPDPSAPDPPPLDPDQQRARADAAIRAIAEGADPAAQAFELSNRFTDDLTGRWSAGLGRLFGRRRGK